MPDETPKPIPTSEDFTTFITAIQGDLQFLLSLYGLKVVVQHVPAIVPVSPQEAKMIRRDAQQKLAQLTTSAAPDESLMLALGTLLKNVNDSSLPGLHAIYDQWRTALASVSKNDTPPPDPTPPRAYPH